MSIKITIISATYNAESCLKELLNSIIPQKTSEIELIIIDGCSQDKTRKIIKEYEAYIDYWISEPDKGVYDAWNKGIKAATGDWIMFLGADDILLPNAFETYLSLLKSKDFSDYDYISSKNEYVDNQGRVLKILGEPASWNLMKKYMSAAHVASLHNKVNLFGRAGLYDLRFNICGDYELLLRKKDILKYFFIDSSLIARMKVGGMSFSIQAIIEAYKIRRLHKTINPLFNIIRLIKESIAYKIFKTKKLI